MRKLFFILALILSSTYPVLAQETEPFYDNAGAPQRWTVPHNVFRLTISAFGGPGGTARPVNSNKRSTGGYGAHVAGEFDVQPGDELIVIVGQAGQGVTGSAGAGGGGGTFVFIVDNTSPLIVDGSPVRLLLVAGGGGGGYHTDVNGSSAGSNANFDTDGKDAGNGGSALNGGVAGNGGQGSTAGGGGGLHTNGGGNGDMGGKAVFSAYEAAGGTSSVSLGGYGGGGAGSATGAGGGGGYSGGAAGIGRRAGGGGSYNSSPYTDENQYTWIMGLSPFTAGGSAAIEYYVQVVLPLKLTSFTAHLQQPGALLRWNTTQEINTSHFEIQKSADGRSYTTIGQITAAGTSPAAKAYSFVDSRLLSKVNHYRLKIVDKNGKFSYSKIVVLRTDLMREDGVQVFPNPAINNLQLQTAIKGTLNIGIYDASGRQVTSLQAKSEGMATSLPIDVSSLRKGIYYIKVQGEDELQTVSFLKK